jgi:hypothetical protein
MSACVLSEVGCHAQTMAQRAAERDSKLVRLSFLSVRTHADDELSAILLLFLVEAQHLLTAIIATALANMMGELRLAAVAARYEVRQRQLIVIAARAFARF